MKKKYLIVDVAKCEDCNNCFLACKDEHVDNDWPGYSAPQPLHGHRWINIFRKERGQYPLIDVAFLPVLCMHCDNAPCIKAANGGVYKRPDGFVICDPEKTKGQKQLLEACPYKAMWWNEEQELPQKCNLCAHLIDQGWKNPRCVQACPTGSLQFIEAEEGEMAKIVDAEKLEVLHPEHNTKPRVYYKNLYLFDKCFISGSISYIQNQMEDCAAGSKVALMKNGGKVAETVADNYGDFRFDNLPEDSGQYQLTIQFSGYKDKMVEVSLGASINIDTVCLTS